jgi:hypothetical protein
MTAELLIRELLWMSFQDGNLAVDEIVEDAVVSAAAGQEQSVHQHPERRHHHGHHRDRNELSLLVIHLN